MVIGAQLGMWAEYDEAVCPCENGETVWFTCQAVPSGDGAEHVNAYWDSGTRRSAVGDDPETLVDGVVSDMWCMDKSGCKDALRLSATESLSSAEKSVYNALQSRPCT